MLDVTHFLVYGILGVLSFAFLLNMLPFTSPSNMVLSGAIVAITRLEPLLVGVAVAMSATSAKIIHFLIVRKIRTVTHVNRGEGSRVHRIFHRYGWLGALIAASSPIPDDPIIIPLALTNYDLAKFTVGYFVGKVAVTLLGAYTGEYVTITVGEMLGPSWVIIASIILTIAITIHLVKRRKGIGI